MSLIGICIIYYSLSFLYSNYIISLESRVSGQSSSWSIASISTDSIMHGQLWLKNLKWRYTEINNSWTWNCTALLIIQWNLILFCLELTRTQIISLSSITICDPTISHFLTIWLSDRLLEYIAACVFKSLQFFFIVTHRRRI